MKPNRLEHDHLAAIDIGTNSFHMVIVKIDKNKKTFKVVDRVKESVRLGQGSSDMKYLTEEAMNRGIEFHVTAIIEAHGDMSIWPD